MNKVLPILTPEEQEELKIISDPVLWAEKYLKNPENPDDPLQLRWYQKDILRNPYKKKAVRWSRRTGKSVSLAVDVIFRLFTNANKRGILICPYETQVESIFDHIETLLYDSPHVMSGIKKITRNPYRIYFGSGSVFRAYTAGIRSGIRAANVRSVGGAYVWMDEADFFDDESIQAILPLLLTTKDTTVWASSTLSGRRSYFYKFITDKSLGFHDDHHGPEVSPNWTSYADMERLGRPREESMEHFFRTLYPGDAYSLEILCEFTEMLDGVFKHSDIDSCSYQYKYADEEVDPNGVYGLGVDWNGDTKGCHFVVVRYYDKDGPQIRRQMRGLDGNLTGLLMNGRLQMVHRESLAVKDTTQTKAVEKIKELNQKYPLAIIAPDSGFATHQIEELRQYGKEHKETGIDKKLFPVEFGGTTKIKDPITKKDVKKWTKPFMVGLTQRLVEDHDLIISETEEGDKAQLISQMREYRVKESSAGTDRPVYVKGNDHILDALMSVVYGITMKFHPYQMYPRISGIAVASQKNFIQGSDQVDPRWGEKDRKPGTMQPVFNKIIPTDWSYRFTEDPRSLYDELGVKYSHVRETGGTGQSGPWAGSQGMAVGRRTAKKNFARRAVSGRSLFSGNRGPTKGSRGFGTGR